jgi:hypothetical protein
LHGATEAVVRVVECPGFLVVFVLAFWVADDVEELECAWVEVIDFDCVNK